MDKEPYEPSLGVEPPNPISKWVILEDGKFNIVWDSVSNITYIISFYLIPLVISTDLDLLEQIWWFELILDFILAFDI